MIWSPIFDIYFITSCGWATTTTMELTKKMLPGYKSIFLKIHLMWSAIVDQKIMSLKKNQNKSQKYFKIPKTESEA